MYTNSNKIKRIALLTSGGDAPGMNAAIRAIVRTGIYNNLEVVGIKNGFSGLLKKDFVEMKSNSVSKIISRGGTILKSARCKEFKLKETREKAFANLREMGIDALIVNGGDGSFRGADLLSKEFGFPVIGIPCTIDNDIYGTDFTIGFDTAINTVIEAVDKIRDTAESHNIIFFVEVMGRDSGFIALYTSIASGAEATLLPEVKTDIKQICSYMEQERRANKTSGIIIVAEGDKEGGATEIARKVKEQLPEYETRVTILGHIQRGGNPSCKDRVLASILGHGAVTALLEGKQGVMVGMAHNRTVYTPLEETYLKHDQIDHNWIEVSKIISL
ncbi:6-phosphofructokinase [Mariniphaga anaerophila]|uniref:ATP-dependent 6-phosphofructokinase n=1 Tax=Mariniphaga anaerophila TaxID=1484053 RepID=A0A1M5G8S2_9BACT|nr:6-phosphofructokinase [Mariniphaga anaerophila]SHG00145.1 6-phosphofructokinase [Mariniphaga anaerophila]